MLDTASLPGRNVIDLTGYRTKRAKALSPRLCCHCGAALAEGDNEDECSSAQLTAAQPAPPRPRRKYRAE
jgi:hypothetical protein